MSEWIEHHGKSDPEIDGYTSIDVKFADGTITSGIVFDWDENWIWDEISSPPDGAIIAYRPFPKPLKR